MKKLLGLFFVFVAMFLFATQAKAETQPTCPAGSHYEGAYEEVQTCNQVCTKKIWGFCIKYENQCTQSGSLVGSCVADEVIEEEEEATSTPEVIEKKRFSDDSLFAILLGMCKEENIAYSDWSPCMTNFGLQIRTATPINGCKLTGLQQANLIKKCGSEMLGLGL